MQVLDYRHSEPTTSPPHNSSWLVDNQPNPAPTPQTTSLPNPHHVLPLASSNSLTGISSQHPPPSSTPPRTSSSSTVHPSSHPSHVTSELYPSQHPSAPRDSPLTDNSRLNTLNYQDNLNPNNATTASNPPHSSFSKLGNLLNVSHAATEHDRDPNHTPGHIDPSHSGSLKTEQHREHIPHTYTHPSQPFSTAQDYHHFTNSYYDQPQLRQPETTHLDRNDSYQPTYRSQFPTEPYNSVNNLHRQDFFNYQQPVNTEQDFARRSTDTFHNNSSPPYPGSAPLPLFGERAYGIPKFDKDVPLRSEVVREASASALPCYRPLSDDMGALSNGFTSTRGSAHAASAEHCRKYVNGYDLAVEGTLLGDTIQAFEAKGMNPERAEFLRDYIELMKAYEEKFDILYDSTERSSMDLMLKSRVPLLEDTITAPVDDETPEDACQKLVVKRRFVDAMEALQGDQLPTKRRGNLPKECTEYLKKWFDEHYENPYPTDEEKLDMSKKTKIGMSQISHWFINYRKRVWKPSLPLGHPALNGGEPGKKPRKRIKTDNVDYNTDD